MKGWFDAFREDGGPTLYTFNNRTPVTGDVTTIILLVVFCTLLIAFLVIFPGIRKEKFTTFISVVLSLFVGCVILVTQHGSAWHIAHTTMVSTYSAFSRDKLFATIGAYVGLNHVNITLRAMSSNNLSWNDIDFNERFLWSGTNDMGNCYHQALKRGIPFPILTVAEYFSISQEGFAWGRQYRAAGYYVSILLWTSFTAWILMNLLLIVVPRYGAYMLVITGLLLIFTNIIYLHLIPENSLVIRFEGGALEFKLGWCFWIVLAAGWFCILQGLIISAIDLIYPNRFSTILEVDYDTPYDRHIIIEESHDKRFKKKTSSSKLEDPPNSSGFGSRILRRLSSKTKEEKLAERNASGMDNQAFELDPPKSPWRYPFSRRVQQTTLGLSSSNINSGGGSSQDRTHHHHQHLRNHQMIRMDSRDSSSSLASSMGVSILNRERDGLPPIPKVHKELTRSLGFVS